MCCVPNPNVNSSEQHALDHSRNMQFLHTFDLLKDQFVGVYSYLEAQLLL